MPCRNLCPEFRTKSRFTEGYRCTACAIFIDKEKGVYKGKNGIFCKCCGKRPKIKQHQAKARQFTNRKIIQRQEKLRSLVLKSNVPIKNLSWNTAKL